MSEAVFGDAPSDFQEKLWTLCTKDHQGHPVELAWVLRDDNVPRYSKPSLPFQVYILDTAPRTIKFGNLPELLARWMDWASVFQPLQRTMCHFEIYRSPFPNVLACIDHQREEIKHRNSREGWSHLVENWADFYLCESCPWNMGYILVIDRDDWTAEGALHVKFAQTSHSQAITTDHAEQCTDLGPPISVHATRNRTTYEFFLTLLKRRRLFENGRKWHAKSASLVRSYGDEIEDFGEDYVDEQTFQTRLEQRRQEARKNREQRRTEYLAECVLSRTRLSTNEQLPGLIVHNYFDDMNWPVSNVWDARHNGRRPELSFTLYLADDTPPVSPQALYTLLHQDAPEDSSWSLDIVWQTTCISTAMQHYSYEAHGWPGRRATARHCLSKFRKQVFRRAVGHIFPEELLQNILDLSSMRRPRKEDLNPTYDSRPHVFMYLDAKSFCSGPQIVIADPQVINSKTITPDDEREVHLKAPWVSSDFADGFHTALEVSHWRSWATVADRLHTLWSLRASRSFKIEEQQLPYFVLDIQVADFCSPRPHGSVDAALRSRSTVPCYPSRLSSTV
ncbi:uncharacterized protein RCC_04247 [Ramularia collo-cygni]|uniref:Uncharacterized protein n=1 Tax=Ramularia collo-cygni TaxID=112498 RepID=A0A2D3VCZ5_9PEZI|nr:uncharacterized protein RCC_04247 [Ramularia collo-cygni]CZT18403.1 uncharacterized protein RCC_04247 [Ramularia collo-cygni]